MEWDSLNPTSILAHLSLSLNPTSILAHLSFKAHKVSL